MKFISPEEQSQREFDHFGVIDERLGFSLEHPRRVYDTFESVDDALGFARDLLFDGREGDVTVCRVRFNPGEYGNYYAYQDPGGHFVTFTATRSVDDFFHD